MTIRSSLLVTLLLAVPVCGQEMQLHLDAAATKVDWTLGGNLHTVHGTFKLKRGDLRFDPATGKASGELDVDATSGESGSGARDRRMHKSILESGKFPEIVFVPDHVSGKVNLQGDSEVQLHGTFRIHGAAHELTMSAKIHADPRKLTGVITFPVPYVKWGMKNPSTLFLRVDDTVNIEIEAAGLISSPGDAGGSR
jgi:polyisoprenoid-binding protein YceI